MADVGYAAGAPVKTKGGEHVLLSFVIDGGSGTPVVKATSGDYDAVVGSVADTTTGTITVTLADKWAHLHVVGCCIDTAAGDMIANCAVTAPQTVVIYVYDTGTGDALEDTADDIYVTLLARRNTDGGT